MVEVVALGVNLSSSQTETFGNDTGCCVDISEIVKG